MPEVVSPFAESFDNESPLSSDVLNISKSPYSMGLANKPRSKVLFKLIMDDQIRYKK